MGRYLDSAGGQVWKRRTSSLIVKRRKSSLIVRRRKEALPDRKKKASLGFQFSWCCAVSLLLGFAVSCWQRREKISSGNFWSCRLLLLILIKALQQENKNKYLLLQIKSVCSRLLSKGVLFWDHLYHLSFACPFPFALLLLRFFSTSSLLKSLWQQQLLTTTSCPTQQQQLPIPNLFQMRRRQIHNISHQNPMLQIGGPSAKVLSLQMVGLVLFVVGLIPVLEF